MKTKTVAVIDVGTLKSKFEIREFDKDYKSKTIYKDKVLTVLGRDLDKNDNMIVEKAIVKTIDALNSFCTIMKEKHVDKYRAVTTEAIRKAKNSEEVLKRITQETGITLEEISQEEEAKIFFRSLSNDFPNETIASADIGGGSVQVVIGNGDQIFEIHNFKTGVYFLQENFSTTHHPTLMELENAKAYIKKELASLGQTKFKPTKLVYGSTNIIDFMQAMNLPLEELRKGSAHPYEVSLTDLFTLYEKIIQLSYEDRMPMFPEEPYYMWGADKALMNIFQISDYLSIKSVVPSNNNLSTGILLELAKSI